MRILVFSDIHSDYGALVRLLAQDADLYIAAGDLVDFGKGLDALGPVLQAKAGKVWVLPGNHESEEDIEAFCARYGLNNLHGKTFDAGWWKVAGLGYSNPTPFDTPGEYSEAELSQRLEKFAGLVPLVLICHAPPRATTLDDAGRGRHFGSTAVRSFIEQHQPEWFFCGHIHEAAGRECMIGSTKAVNVGKKGYLLDLGKMG